MDVPKIQEYMEVLMELSRLKKNENTKLDWWGIRVDLGKEGDGDEYDQNTAYDISKN